MQLAPIPPMPRVRTQHKSGEGGLLLHPQVLGGVALPPGYVEHFFP